MTALLRSLSLFTAIALLLFVGLHAVVPHVHPSEGGPHVSEVSPFTHADNKLFVLAFLFVALPFLLDIPLSLVVTIAQRVRLSLWSTGLVAQTIPIRYHEALRRGRIHSRVH